MTDLFWSISVYNYMHDFASALSSRRRRDLHDSDLLS